MPYTLPLVGRTIRDVTGNGRFTLRFDMPENASLFIEDSFVLIADGTESAFDPPCPEWVRCVILSLCAVRIVGARFSRHGRLSIKFSDGRELCVGAGAENWHYSDAAGLYIHGGV
jgi:hypothetical protein